MMDPLEFITVAIKLSNGTLEAELRSSVSRAYYGALHVAKQLLEQCGVSLSHADNPHEKVYFCLDNCNDEATRDAAIRLKRLRGIRNEADYRLSSDHFTNRRNIQRHLNSARAIVDAIATCYQRLDTIRPDLQRQAKLLGLRVID
jgi:uncharacterized protein (UPF0332 family)